MTEIAPGVRVKCVKSDRWCSRINGFAVFEAGPTLGSVWTIEYLYQEHDGTFLEFMEWPNGDVFLDKWFIPLEGNEDLSELETALDRGVDEARKVKIEELIP